MKHRATPRFWRCYKALPKAIQELADRSYELLKLAAGGGAKTEIK